ncbi:unnamed protein product [Periconia digitata]|uniref:non-specific serine/threonine protein kinase n=1 Tax=Periconia digitata TaxID=1303443 RepID=A0A9W4XS21_9PLEO|nr:unnamed protein product [Periconia digitata]
MSTRQPNTVVWWYPQDWELKLKCNPNVEILARKTNPNELVVKKIMRNDIGENTRPKEIQLLDILPDTNRILKPFIFLPSYPPNTGKSTAIFQYYPLGDLYSWQNDFFANDSNKPVPEPHILRMFVQMSEALAFVHGEIWQGRDQRSPIVHRDVKPHNILVVNNGSAFPSFRLIDFGLSHIWTDEKSQESSLSGTHAWQPPENPYINTFASDIWALGAVVQYMATRKSPAWDFLKFRAAHITEHGGIIPEARHYRDLYTCKSLSSVIVLLCFKAPTWGPFETAVVHYNIRGYVIIILQSCDFRLCRKSST